MKGNIGQLIDSQVRRWALERRGALEQAARANAPQPIRIHPIIGVSRQMGSGGTELAEIVARRLGFQLFDKEMIDAIAAETGVQKELVEALDEKARNGIEQWVDGALHKRIFTSQDFVRSMGKTLITLARAGSAVIIGRGANFILEGEPGLHVRVVGGVDFRIRRVMRVLGMDAEEARAQVERSDRERREFVHRYLHRDIDDLTGYHLVLNLEQIGLDQAVEVTLDLYRMVLPVEEGPAR